MGEGGHSIERPSSLSVRSAVWWRGDRAALEAEVRSWLERQEAGFDVSAVEFEVAAGSSTQFWTVELVSSALTESELNSLMKQLVLAVSAQPDPPPMLLEDPKGQIDRPPAAALGKGGVVLPKRADPIDRLVGEQLHPGRVAFNPPRSMTVGQQERFVVRITRTEDLDRELIGGIDRPSETLLSSVQTSYRMKVVCSCTKGLTVRPLSEEIQVVATNRYTEWQYAIDARASGEQIVWVSASALLGELAGGVHSIISLPVLHHAVDVTITPAKRVVSFARDNWKWLVATGFALSSGVVAWIGVFAN